MALSRAQQSAKQSTTVRDIVRRAKGRNPDIEAVRSQSVAFFGNFPNNVDLQECLNTINRSQEMFNRLPPLVRQRFGNQPVQLLQFIQNEDNYSEACNLGLIAPERIAARERAEKERIAAEKAAAKQPGT